MSFRIEQKLLVNKDRIFSFKEWLVKNNSKKIFPDRKIKSIYFENHYNQMFLDSEEGCVPRKKIRIRSYPMADKKTKNLEIKISSIEGRFKKQLNINESNYISFINNGYFDQQYGICLPRLEVNYLREYHSLFGIRVTIDKNINYKKTIKNSLPLKDEEEIIELKTNNSTSIDYLLNSFPIEKTRFSKYCRAYNKLFQF
jgi:hypothetical protein